MTQSAAWRLRTRRDADTLAPNIQQRSDHFFSAFAMEATPGASVTSKEMTFYCHSSWWSASLPTPDTVPVNSPVVVKKTGLLRASATSGTTVSVNVRVPY